jgi:hypothetical protein
MIPNGWKRNCDYTLAEVDNKMKIVNQSFDTGGKRITTKILFQSKDFQLNVNYSNMVLAMCMRDILCLDLDLPSGSWNLHEADQMINDVKRFCDFMHNLGTDLKFKIYRTDKGIHAILVNKRLDPSSDEALTIMLSLCNDPFYTAFSRISGWCLRVGPKIYRNINSNTSMYGRVTSEIISMKYKPNFIGYGEPDKDILNLLQLKDNVIRYVKTSYRNNIAQMTKLRYIPYVDEFKHCPPDSFFDSLVDMIVREYPVLTDNEEEYEYYIDHSFSSAALVNLYNQEDFMLSYDPYDNVFLLNLKDYFLITFNHINLDKALDIQKYVSADDVLISVRDQMVLITNDSDKIENIKEFDPNATVESVYLRMTNDLTSNNITHKLSKQNKLVKHLDDYFISLYDRYSSEMNQRNVLRQKKLSYVGPSIEMLDMVREDFIDLISELSLIKTETLTGLDDPVHSIRYNDILPNEVIKKCFINLHHVKNRFKILKPLVLKSAGSNYISIADVFVYGQSDFANMLFLSNYDLLMLDWDVGDGIRKLDAIKILRRFIESQSGMPEKNRLFKKTPCFKLYETDNGVHAYLISHRVNHQSELSAKLMIEVCSDVDYAVMSRLRGFSVRLTPKVFKNGKYLPIEDVEGQFIQSPFSDITYLGDTNNIDPYLEGLVDIIYKIQQHILSFGTRTVYDTLINRDRAMIDKWGEFLLDLYYDNIGLSASPSRIEMAKTWAENYDNIERIEAVKWE